MSYIKFIVSGYGGEVLLHKITKKCAEFWQSAEMHEHMDSYLGSPEWFAEENPDIKIPKYAQLPQWYECENRAHEYGAAESMAQLEIVEMDGPEWNSKQIKDIYYGSFSEFVDDNGGPDLVISEEEIMPKPKDYTLACVHSEKGTFYEGTIEIEGEFEPTKVSFDTTNIHEDILITGVYYNGEYVDNNGGDTVGKSLDIDIIEPWE
jgi:hypothetical protein